MLSLNFSPTKTQNMGSDLVVSSSATTHQPEHRPFDVFLSFRGEDTRDNFVSHLYKALCDHQIKTFIDYDLNRGEDFPPALLTAIEESSISIIIFSENYANSIWCLKELDKIMDCKKYNGQIVLPVFYRVDPAHVRAQTGNFGASFRRLQDRLNGEMDLDKVWSHLMEAANLSGWNSQIIRPEAKLINEIVGDVLHKLNLISFSYFTNLIGIFRHMENVEFLLCLDKPDICVVGIWGMGGIGKTTIAKAVFNHICGRFDECYMLLNVDDELQTHSVNALRDKLLSNIFEKDIQSMGSQILRPHFIRRQLQQKKVLIVLDDVNNPIHLKELLGVQDYSFGTGSKIIVTSRDRQVLKSVTVSDKIYEVEIMNKEDAITLFSVNAFKQKYPTRNYKELSVRVVNYARGNPLALVILGSALFDKSKEEWLSALEGLEKEPNSDIQKVLRISYGILSREEKKIFLDIACFLYRRRQNFVNEYYGISGLFKIKSLQDKSLITISSFNTIEMHDLLKNMGQSIDREEYFHKPEKRERLWAPTDICRVLAKKKGTAKTKAVSLDMSKIKEMYLDADVFVGMDSLQYLEFYNYNSDYDEKNKVYFYKCCGGLAYLPEALRYFHWDGFPANHLSSNFCAENLIELRLNRSNVKTLWRGVQDIRNLRVISLRYCKNLIKLPDLSKARSLREIDLEGCKRCRNVPSKFISEALESLNLSYCLNVRRFPDISSRSLKYLYLKGTNIKEVPSSIESLSRLEDLYMDSCRRLSTISPNIGKLKFLNSFNFSHCVKLESFPEILEPLEHLGRFWLNGCLNVTKFPDISSKSLKYMYLEGTDIEEVPSSIESLSGLEQLVMNDCRRLSTISTKICKLTSLEFLSFERCVKLESFPEIIEPLEHLREIRLSGCVNLKILSGNWYNLKSLQKLILSDTGITELLPMYDGHFNSKNQDLCSDGCKSGTNLPKLTCCSSYVEEIEEIRLPSKVIKEPPPPRVQCIPSPEAASIIDTLSIDRCHSLNMSSFANTVPYFSSLFALTLSGNNWESLPENMDRLSNLRCLFVSNCKNLRSIPKLPLSLLRLEANDCESLECIYGMDLTRLKKLRKEWLLGTYIPQIKSEHLLMHMDINWTGSGYDDDDDDDDDEMGKEVSFELSDREGSLDVKSRVQLLVKSPRKKRKRTERDEWGLTSGKSEEEEKKARWAAVDGFLESGAADLKILTQKLAVLNL